MTPTRQFDFTTNDPAFPPPEKRKTPGSGARARTAADSPAAARGGDVVTAPVRREKPDAGYKQSVPMGRYGNGGELNPAAIFLGAEESSYVTGQIVAVDGGYTCV